MLFAGRFPNGYAPVRHSLSLFESNFAPLLRPSEPVQRDIVDADPVA